VDEPGRKTTPQDETDETTQTTRMMPSGSAAPAAQSKTTAGPDDEVESTHALPPGTRLHEFEITGIAM